MIFIYVILCLHVMVSRCQPQCAKETPDDKDFSLNVTEHVAAESGECIRISYELTFLTSNVTAPYTKIWFRQDNSDTLYKTFVSEVKSESEASFTIRGLPRGEYEYGFKLEWRCNQTYVFPKKIHISVSASTKTPDFWVPPMEEGDVIRLRCRPPHFCSEITDIYWKWTQADGQSEVLHRDFYPSFYHDYDYYPSLRRGRKYQHFRFLTRHGQFIDFFPTADHHNTNITCVVEYDDGAVETTVTMTVKFPPKILPGSQCIFKGKLLVCECISRGNPLPPITWPLAPLTDYSVTSSSSNHTVNSIITVPAADYHNNTVTCVSSNELGRDEIEIRLQNDTENSRQNNFSDGKQNLNGLLPWIIMALSLFLNLVLLTCLITYIRKKGKSKPQKKMCTEMDTYASLNRADVEQEYSVISPRHR